MTPLKTREVLPPTGKWYVMGHVVSIDIFGEASVIPMEATLLDIQATLGATDVRLPTLEDFDISRERFFERAEWKYYGYLFKDGEPIPEPTPTLDALLRAIALHIVSQQNVLFMQKILQPRDRLRRLVMLTIHSLYRPSSPLSTAPPAVISTVRKTFQ
jgi:hypothetical protein